MIKKNICLAIALALCASLCASLCACGAPHPITGSQFQERVVNLGYTTEDITHQYVDIIGYPKVVRCIGFASYPLHFEFFEMADVDFAVEFFRISKDQVDEFNRENGEKPATDTDKDDYQKYVMTTGGIKYVIARVDTTVLYAYCEDISDLTQFNNAIKAVGY